MYHSPRRPYFNRSQNMPQATQNDDTVSIDSNRFWKLLKKLQGRQADTKTDDQPQPAKSGK